MINARKLNITTGIYFILANTAYFWEKLPGFWDMGIFALLLMGFAVLSLAGIVWVVKIIRERFVNRANIMAVLFLALALTLSVIFPAGILDFSRLEGKDLLVANAEGVANCTLTMTLKENNRFLEKSICFGVDEYRGTYKIEGDTVNFCYDRTGDAHEQYAFAIVNSESTGGEMLCFKKDSTIAPLPLSIRKNLLFNIHD